MGDCQESEGSVAPVITGSSPDERQSWGQGQAGGISSPKHMPHLTSGKKCHNKDAVENMSCGDRLPGFKVQSHHALAR